MPTAAHRAYRRNLRNSKDTQINPYSWVLSFFKWQISGTLTFERDYLHDNVRLSIAMATLRDTAEELGIYAPKFQWGLKREEGEIGGRVHFHFIIAGLRKSELTPKLCRFIGHSWRSHGGSYVRIEIKDDSLDAMEYFLKDSHYKIDIHKAMTCSKFGSGHCEPMLSDAVWRESKRRSKRERVV